jgi:aminoglycoside/choline kinase family phosphotransferase
MDDRQRQLQHWSKQALALSGSGLDWTTVAGDASSRRYFRLRQGVASWICVDAPPASEKNQAFIDVRALLAEAGVRVPALIEWELQQGFLLLEDLGDQLLLGLLNTQTAPAYYQQALAMLFKLQTGVPFNDRVPLYSEEILREELSRFSRWFCGDLLGLEFSVQDLAILQSAEGQLIESATAQPQTLVHLDYHSRNLLMLPAGEIATIDFQDARWGPLCYDLVSLLRDCYVRWPEQQVEAWALQYRRRLLAGGQDVGTDEAQFLRWFDWMGLQRHIKVLGNFSRLAIQDNKPGYLADIPLVLDYIVNVLGKYQEFAELQHWLGDRVMPRVDAALDRAQT